MAHMDATIAAMAPHHCLPISAGDFPANPFPLISKTSQKHPKTMVAAGDLHIFGTIYGVFHIPSGNLLQFAIENGDLIIVDLPIENGGIFHWYVCIFARG